MCDIPENILNYNIARIDLQLGEHFGACSARAEPNNGRRARYSTRKSSSRGPQADSRELLAKDADRPVVQNLPHVRGGARRHGTPHAYVLKMLDRRNVGVCRVAVHQQELGTFLPVRVLQLLLRLPAMHGLPEDGPSHPAVAGGEEHV